MLVILGIQQTNNVKNRVTSCSSSGGGDARLAVTSQWQRPCRPSLCSWPSLTWWLGFSAGLRAVGTSHHTGGLPGRLCYAPPGEGTWQGGVLWAQTMCRLHCLAQEIHYSWSLQIDEKAMCESVSVCVCADIPLQLWIHLYSWYNQCLLKHFKWLSVCPLNHMMRSFSHKQSNENLYFTIEELSY